MGEKTEKSPYSYLKYQLGCILSSSIFLFDTCHTSRLVEFLIAKCDITLKSAIRFINVEKVLDVQIQHQFQLPMKAWHKTHMELCYFKVSFTYFERQNSYLFVFRTEKIFNYLCNRDVFFLPTFQLNFRISPKLSIRFL